MKDFPVPPPPELSAGSEPATCPQGQLASQPGSSEISSTEAPIPATGGGDATQTRLPGSGSAAPPLPAPVGTAVPQQVGRFSIRRFLGEGVFGRVYEAYDQSLRREVALKVAKPEQLASPGRVRRFEREAQAAAGLTHPNIVGVYDHGQDGPHHYIAMTFIRGRSLESLLEEQPAGRALPLEQAAGIVRKLAEALAYAHRHEVIHRDVKPANVLIDEQGEPLLADFGLAARADEEHRETRGGALGTPAFTAPEQWQGKAGPGSDQYSLGCLLFELLTGQTPFAGGNDGHYMFLHLNEPPPSPRRLRAEVPRDLETVCLKCLQKEPARRYADCQALADDLRRWLEGEPIAARRVGRIESAVKWVRRNPVVARLLAAVIVAVVLGTTISVAFGLHARQREKEARTALEAVEDNLAVGLLRPLGHFKHEIALNDFELEAVEELASLPRERDRVRRLFLTRALEKPGTAGQLGRRLEEAVIAAVGLRQDLRRETMREAARCLADGDTSREAKVVCARLLAQLRCEEPDAVALAASTLIDEMAQEVDPRSLNSLSEAFAALATKLPPEQAGTQVDHIVGLATKTTDPDSFNSLSAAFVALAGKLTAGQAGKQAGMLAERIVVAAKTTDADSLGKVSGTFATLAGKLPAEQAGKQAGTLAGRIVKLAVKTNDIATVNTLSQAFVRLVGKLPAEQAGTLGNRIVELADETIDPASMGKLSGAFATLARRLQSEQAGKQAGTLAGRIVDLAVKTSDPNTVNTLSKVFVRLAGNLPPEQAGKQAGTLAGRIVDLAVKRTDQDPDSPNSLTEALTTLAGKLPAEQADTLAERIVDFAAKTSHPVTLRILSEAFAALAGKLPAEQAGKRARMLSERIVVLFTRSIDHDSLRTLSQAFAILAAKLPAEQAGKQATTLADRIVVLAANSTDPNSLNSLSEAFAALPGQLPAEQAGKVAGELAEHIVEFAAKTRNLDSLNRLTQAFLALAGKLPVKQAGKHTGTLASRIVELAPLQLDSAMPIDVDSLNSLSQAFTALAGKLPAEQAGTLAERIVDFAAKKSHPVTLRILSEAFAALAGKLPAEQAGNRAFRIAGQIVKVAGKTTAAEALTELLNAFTALPGKPPEGQATIIVLQLTRFSHKPQSTIGSFGVGDGSFGYQAQHAVHGGRLHPGPLGGPGDERQPLDRLLPLIGTQAILEALKQPSCVGTTRSALLKHLGKKYNRSFGDVWQLVEYLKQLHQDLGLESPLGRTSFVPQAQEREVGFGGTTTGGSPSDFGTRGVDSP